jgi:hypothetical protein
MRRWGLTGSLRFRLLAATAVALSAARVLAGLLLSGLFRDHVMRQFESTLTTQLDQLTARLEVDAGGQPQIDGQRLSDPRWDKPYSGLYWQVNRVSPDGQTRNAVLRSRSLWDDSLALQADALVDGQRHVHPGTGPLERPLMMVERTVRLEQDAGVGWRLVVASDLAPTEQAVRDFNRSLALSLAGLGLLLVLAALAQVTVGLAPLKALQRALNRVRAGNDPRLQGSFPDELQPLIHDFNAVLDRNAQATARAHPSRQSGACAQDAAGGDGSGGQRSGCARDLACVGDRAGGTGAAPARLASGPSARCGHAGHTRSAHGGRSRAERPAAGDEQGARRARARLAGAGVR